MCSKSFISVIIVYAISLIYLFQTNTKFWGYVMLIIAYLFSYGYAYQFREPLTKGVGEFNTFVFGKIQGSADDLIESYYFRKMVSNIFSQSAMEKLFIFILVLFAFINVYSLIKILNAYSFKSSKTGSFDLKLNKKHTKELKIFDWSFIVGNASFFAFLYYLIAAGGNKLAITFDYKWILLLIAFVSCWVSIGTAVEFSYVKRE